ncbi:hypothetical protein KVT40_003593 [Elsinoe batatas]|uniref:DUF7907 domain-containing protein n=1 Tax=Elsinoe batatas TaxID=2601811 RepID=A0A8K0PD65_9PEZI|nr:hypothetical protein KVT40_003593 [Elsinoe batatas]
MFLVYRAFPNCQSHAIQPRNSFSFRSRYIAQKGQILSVMVAIPNEAGRLESNVTVSLDSSYSDWSPMRANASATSLDQGSFLLDGNGLQLWRGSDIDGKYIRGFLVCNWAKSSPQLFARVQANEGAEKPSSCADVWLMPKYV